MDRVCTLYRVVDTGHGGANVFVPGMVYDVKEVRDGQALVNGIWVPNYIFNQKQVKELSK